jgi:predicted RNA-binding Zn-ribbon protein involved in translation (DUF1610 family)
MDKFMAKLRCPHCGTAFRVELRRMRLNLPNSCPSCGAQYGISRDQAIGAHRLLERLEHRDRIAS